MDEKHKLYWGAGIAVAAVVLYFLLRSPSSGSSGGGTVLYSTGITPDQAVQLAEAGMSYKLGLAQNASGERVNLAGIAAAKSVTNRQTAAATKQTQILGQVEEALGRLQLQGLLSSNATSVDIAKLQSSTLENITEQNRPSAFVSTLDALGGFFNQVGGQSTISDLFKSLANIFTKSSPSAGTSGGSIGALLGSGGNTGGLPGVLSI